MELVAEIPCQCELGEGILWHPQQERIWWTDILGGSLYSASLLGDDVRQYPTPEPITAFGFIADTDKLIVSFASGIAFFWPTTGKLEWLVRPDLEGAPRLNDGRVSPAGEFWVGSMSPETPGSAKLYRYNGQWQPLLDGLTIANGLCWSPDGTYVYHADSPQQVIRRFEHSAGELRGGEVFARTLGHSYPDGGVTDAEGNLWSAQWGGSCVQMYSADGAAQLRVPLPVSQPTCVAFGGAELNYLLVTSAWEHMTPEQRQAEPRAGNVFVFKTKFRGNFCDFYTS